MFLESMILVYWTMKPQSLTHNSCMKTSHALLDLHII